MTNGPQIIPPLPGYLSNISVARANCQKITSNISGRNSPKTFSVWYASLPHFWKLHWNKETKHAFCRLVGKFHTEFFQQVKNYTICSIIYGNNSNIVQWPEIWKLRYFWGWQYFIPCNKTKQVKLEFYIKVEHSYICG